MVLWVVPVHKMHNLTITIIYPCTHINTCLCFHLGLYILVHANCLLVNEWINESVQNVNSSNTKNLWTTHCQTRCLSLVHLKLSSYMPLNSNKGCISWILTHAKHLRSIWTAKTTHDDSVDRLPRFLHLISAGVQCDFRVSQKYIPRGSNQLINPFTLLIAWLDTNQWIFCECSFKVPESTAHLYMTFVAGLDRV